MLIVDSGTISAVLEIVLLRFGFEKFCPLITGAKAKNIVVHREDF